MNPVFRVLTVSAFLFALGCAKAKEPKYHPCELKSTVVLDRPANATGLLRRDGNIYLISRDGYLDNNYVPCNLPDSLKLDNLRVRFSGTVYETSIEKGQPCCRYAMELTGIQRL